MPRRRQLFNPASTDPFPLSRSKLECYLRCPRCFYLDRRLGIPPPGMPPFTLNNAVDKLLKKEFDHYRNLKQPHPLIAHLNLIPYAHPDLPVWRNNFKGISHHHVPTNFMLSGAVDDLWENQDGEIIVADYKATSSKEEIISLNSEYRLGYKRQLEFYQFLFRANGFSVSSKAYLVYGNARTDRDSFDGKLEFDMQLLEVMGSTEWIEAALLAAKACLSGDPPAANPGCELCGYVERVREAV